MRRREFIALVGGVVAAWPLAARAQHPSIPLIWFLGAGSAESYADRVVAFRQGLGETGYVEGKNVAIDFRWAEDQYDRLPDQAAVLVRRGVAIIVATPTPSALAAKVATATIPVVFFTAADPVEVGLVASMSRPGGNLTGVGNLYVEIGPKLLELMHELVPTATIIALLVNPTNPAVAKTQTRDLQVAARNIGVQLKVLHASTERDFDEVFTTMVKLRAGALVIGVDQLFATRSKQLAAMALRHAVPAWFCDA